MNIRALPLFVYLLLTTTLLMFVPAAFAAFIGDTEAARVFAFSATVLLTVSITIAIAMVNRKPKPTGRLHLITLLMAYLILPLICALPFSNLTPSISISQAYFEMMSSFTTTGASMFDDPFQISATLHLWRSIVAWFGGLVILVAAIAIMEPLNLGGFEIRSSARGVGQKTRRQDAIGPSQRVLRVTSSITPLYFAATLILSLALVVLGDSAFVAICHSMAIVSTSGISPIGGLEHSNSGLGGEAVILCFLMLALSHRFFNREKLVMESDRAGDAELRIAILIALFCSTVLFVFHFVGLATEDTSFTFWRAFRAWWGGLFTTISFLTTTGFMSEQWGFAKAWADLESVGLILLVLTVLGGGIATTAGGIKLLRVYVLYKHGERELARLVHPSSVAGFGSDARHVRREGAYVTWMFVMLFVLSIAGISLALSLCGLGFESAFVLAIASLSNTGPLAGAFGDQIESYSQLSDNARMYLDISMIIGRMEILAVVALLNTVQWRV